MNAEDLCALDARTLALGLRQRDFSCRELMAATLARIERLNPRLNALVSLAAPDGLLQQADMHDAELARGEARGPLHGLPWAVKDTAHAAGFPTSQGSPLLKDAIAPVDSLQVARIRAAGAIVIGKSNVPEFGLGSHSFNTVYGCTANAWDGTRSAGGSSGGAAVALAQRLLPLADGSDFMGSLRNPAGWNHVFGLRPATGRVPYWPAEEVWITQLTTEGPMARCVHDLALLLSVQAGRDDRVPMSIAGAAEEFQPPAGADLRGVRFGWLGDLGGHLAMEDGVLATCEAALARCAGAGAVVEPLALGYPPEAVWDAWLVWRCALVAPRIAAHLERPGAREQIKPEALWEHERAQGLGFAEFHRASTQRSAFHAQLLRLFERFDLLALPSAQVWPFDANERWPRQIAGRTMDTYHRWMEVTIHATLAGLPAISVPAGFHSNGRWPMGLQLIGRPQAEAELLRIAAGYEAASSELLARRPPESV